MKKVLFALSIMVMVGLQAMAQTTNVTGTVTDAADGSPIPGVSVFVKGTTIGTVTTPDGTYTLTVPNDATTIVFSFVGMTTQEVAYNGQTSIDAAMQSDAVDVGEVMVVAYGTAKKSSFTGSAAQVKAERLESKNVSEITKALAGEVAGVTVTNTSGQPGKNATIRIRGLGSVNASSAPMYVVDGIPYNGDISSISPSDIESTTVLKDASATAIYGSRGSNGVIVITTKKGKKGKNEIEVEVKSGINWRALPEYDVVDSPERFVELSWEGLRNSDLITGAENAGVSIGDYWTADNLGVAAVYANANIFDGKVGIAPMYNMWDADGDKLIDPTTGRMVSGLNRKYTPESWDDNMFDAGQRLQADLRFRGGVDKLTYYTSVGYLKDEGYYIGSDFNRMNARGNLNYEPKKWMKATTNIAYTYSEINQPGQTSAANNGFSFVNNIPSLYPVFKRDENGDKIVDPHVGGYMYDFGRDGEQVRRYAGDINPAGAVRLDMDETVSHETSLNQMLEFKLMEGLSFNTRFGLQYLNSNQAELTNPLYGDAKGLGRITRSNRTYLSYTWNQILRYKTELGNDHHINAFVGHESTYYEYRTLYASNNTIARPDVAELANGAVMDNMNSYVNNYALESYFGQISYDYLEKYFLYASLRSDGSSRFSEGNKWGTFGSVSGAWVISKENFMQDVGFVKSLKVKASYGLTGNQSLLDTGGYSDYYPYHTTYSVGNLDGKLVLTPNKVNNENITWETSKQFSTGIETELTNYLTLDVEYFNKLTDDMLFTTRVSPSTGNALWTVNDGQMTNAGFEFNATIHAINTGDMKLDLRINGASYTNEMKKMPIDNSTGEEKILDIQGLYAYSNGHSILDYYMKEWAGVDSETGLGQWYGYYEMNNGNKEYITSLTEYLGKGGSMDNLEVEKVSDYNNATNKYVGKSAIPDLAGAFGFDFSYKGITASAQFLYSIGGYSYDYIYAGLMANGMAGANSWSTDIEGRWQKPGDITDVPRLSNSKDPNVTGTSTRFLTKSDYIALNNVKLGYDFPESLLRPLKLSAASLWVSGDNLWLSSKRTGFNPTTSISGSTSGARYAPLSTVTVGLKVKF